MKYLQQAGGYSEVGPVWAMNQGRCKTLEEAEVRNMTNSSPLGKEKESSGKEEADGKLNARQLWFGAGFQGEQGCPNVS